MSKREKIILFIMCLTLIYGYYVFFIETPTKTGGSVTPSSNLDSYNKFITLVSEQTREGLSDVELYIIDHISQSWTKDPLLTTTTESIEVVDGPRAPAETEKVPADIAYTGFLQMGANNMAIINGVEYESGDELISGDFRVGAISARRVTLIETNGGGSITVPLEEKP